MGLNIGMKSPRRVWSRALKHFDKEVELIIEFHQQLQIRAAQKQSINPHTQDEPIHQRPTHDAVPLLEKYEGMEPHYRILVSVLSRDAVQ